MAGISIDEKVRQVAAMADAPSLGGPQVELLRKALHASNARMVTAAARVAGKRGVRDLQADMAMVLARLLDGAGPADKGCLAKTALAEALDAMGSTDDVPFLRGVRYRQMEPSYGGPVDTAGPLRARCALALARMTHPDAAREVLPLLVDTEPDARAAAVRALAYIGGQAGELLLRLKALTGDEHPAVVGECLSALMKMDPAGSLEFVASFLDPADLQVATEAAMALGASQDPRAGQILCDARTSQPDDAWREMLLVPIAMTRCDPALEALFETIADEPADAALAAIKAAALQGHDSRWRDRIAEAVALRDDAAVARAFEQTFPAP